MSTAQGRRFKASLFTLPRIWDEIQVLHSRLWCCRSARASSFVCHWRL